MPKPDDAIVSLAVQENPLYKHLFEEKVEEPAVEEVVEEVIVDEPVEEEVKEELTVEETIEIAMQEDNGIEIDIDEELEEPQAVIAEINGEDMDITEQYNLIASFNESLTHDEVLERAIDMSNTLLYKQLNKKKEN